METFKVYVRINKNDTNYTELNETNGYDVITPIYLSLRKTSMFDFGLIQFLTENDITIKPFSKCKIEITKNSTTKTLYFYTANNIKTKINETVNQHNLYLIEPTKILERYIIGARAFSKDSIYTPTNKSLIETMLDTCLARSPFTVWSPLTTTLNTNDRKEFLEPNKDLFLSEQTTLLEALIKVGGRMNAFPRLVDFQTLEFDFYDRNLEEYEIPTDSKYFEAVNSDIDTFATSIESYANNILDTDKTMYELDKRHGISVRSETLRITKDTAMIVTSKPIYKIKKVWIAPNENTRFLCRWDGNNIILQTQADLDITNYVYEKREYNMLDYDDSSGATEYQLKALYYDSGDNKIQGLFGYHDNWLLQSGEVIEKILLSAARDASPFPSEVQIINLNVTPANDYLNLEYIIEYETLDDIKVSAYKDRWQQSSLIPNTIIYNQSANIINFNYYGEHLQATVDKMANNEVDITLRLKNENIPTLNQCIFINNKKYNINEIDIESYNTYKKVKIKASNNYNRIAEDIDIDSQLKLFDIPNDNYIVDRIIKLDTFIFLNKEYTKNDSDLTQYGKRLVMEALTTYDTTGNTFTPIANVIVRGLNNLAFLLPINYLTTTKKAVMSFGFNDNYVGGTQKEDTTDNKGAVNINTFYTDDNGNIESIDLNIGRLQAEINYKPNKLPLNDNYSFPKRLLGTVIPITVKKDVREKLKFNYQINILSDNEDLIIGNSFSNNLGLFHKYKDAKKYVYFSTTKLYENFKRAKSGNCYELVDGVATVGLSNSITINRDYTDAYMGEEHNNYLNISITDDLKQLYKAFAIVDENYETIFICNDIDIEKIYFNFSNYYNE